VNRSATSLRVAITLAANGLYRALYTIHRSHFGAFSRR